MRPVLILFAKAPLPGRVKTRLCPFLDPSVAAALHAAMVRDTLELLFSLSSEADIELSTDIETDAWQDIRAPRTLQGDGDLGDRLWRALAGALAAGRPRAVVAGSDSPALPAGHIASLLRSAADAALGPTEDGGFYAISCRRTAPAMFQGVRWSSPDALADAVSSLRSGGLDVELGQPWFDIDEPHDLLRLQHMSNLPRHTAAWVASHAQGQRRTGDV